MDGFAGVKITARRGLHYGCDTWAYCCRWQIGVARALEADIDLAIDVGIAGNCFDRVEAVVGIGADLDPRFSIVIGLPDAIDVIDPANDIDRRIALARRWCAEAE